MAATEATVDSSPQITRLEKEYSDRSVIPSDPALAFIDGLIEDFGDEWVTKAMYHYRWTYDADIDKAGHLLPVSRDLQMNSDQLQKSYDFITSRQISRRALVGSTEENTPIIESSYERLLDILTQLFSSNDFLLGDRPGRGDFGIYGQLTQLAKWDPTPMAVAATRAPKVISWVDRVDDLSWLPVDGEEGWVAFDSVPDATARLLCEIGQTYAPFMLANAQALVSGADEVVCAVEGGTYRQAPFKYQGKCLQWLLDEYASLESEARDKVDALLNEAGTSKSHALSATIWLKDINRDFTAMNEVWNAWVDPENKPVRATVEAAMARDILLVEIQVTAALDKNPFEDLNY